MTTDTDELRRLLEAATPGPWDLAGTDGMGFAVHRGEHETVALYCDRDDAALIAAAVNALPGLLDENAALRAQVAELRAAVERVEALSSKVARAADERWCDHNAATNAGDVDSANIHGEAGEALDEVYASLRAALPSTPTTEEAD